MKRHALSIFLAIVFLPACAAAGDEIVWRPVTPDELKMQSPRVDPSADAEAIFWEVRLDDRKQGKISYNHYVRVKIFSERGRERFSKVIIPFSRGKKIEDISARVTRPDGTVVFLKPEDIFEQETVAGGENRQKTKSFAVPAAAPGVIVEYQYKEVYKDYSAGGVRLYFQLDVPLQRVTYWVRPEKGRTLGYHYYNMPETRFEKTDDGYYTASLTNVPAYKVEPNMPPQDEVRRWVYLSYGSEVTVKNTWREINRYFSYWLTEYAQPTRLITEKTAEITAGAVTEDDKLRRIYRYVQTGFKNIDYDRSLTEEERDRLNHKHAEDVIKKGLGNAVYLQLLFAAMARAAGFEVNLVFAGNRSENFFDPEKYPIASMIHLSSVAVKSGAGWKYFNPAVPYLPYGYTRWTEESVASMLVAPDGYLWLVTDVTEQDRSPARRTGKFTLLDDGALAGAVKLEYWGQQAIRRRGELYFMSAEKRLEAVENEVRNRMSTAEVSGVAIENFDDSERPLTYSYKVRVPNYAQKTGKRFLLQPGFFENGLKTVFSSAARTHNIHFSYPWSERDEIEIKLPAGYVPENPESPAEVFDGQKIGAQKISIGLDKATNTLQYRRLFYFGRGKSVLFPREAYPIIKDLFDSFYKADNYVTTLIQQ